MTQTSEGSIWLVEDDEACRDIVVSTLAERWSVRCFGSLGALEEAALDTELLPRLLIADVCLPDHNLVTWLSTAAARRILARVTLLVVSALDEVEVIRSAFTGGAVDFLSKPFGRAELTVKIERAVDWSPPSPAAANEPSLDVPGMVVRQSDGRTAALTAKEMQIVALLWNAPLRALPRDAISASLWRDCRVGRRTLDVHLSRLRHKLRPLDIDVRVTPSHQIALVPLGAEGVEPSASNRGRAPSSSRHRGP